jgi:cell division protein FtsI/penicillin-binding protein 2
VSYADIEKSINDPVGNPSEPIEVARGVKESTIIFLNEHLDRYPGVTTAQTWERVYPNGTLAAHVLGYVGRINAEDLAKMPDDLHYQPDDMLGQSGIEKSFERQLRGIPGKYVVEKDSKQRVIVRQEVYPPTPGSDVRLTIDIDVQRLTEQSLVRGLKVARLNTFVNYTGSAPTGPIKAHSGSAVVTDPNTGEIIAMASYPTFDPRVFVRGITAKDYARLTAPGQHTPLINRAVSGRYPPGSTFKLVTALASMETVDNSGHPLLTPNDLFNDVGYYEIPSLCDLHVRCRWRNAGDSVFGTLSLRSAMKVSSDAFFYRLGHEFAKSINSEDGIQKMARSLGFGKLTNVKLPSESTGVIPDRARLDRLHRLYPKEFPRTWKLGDTINVAIGQGDVLVTPLQMNRAWGALANGGTVLDAKIDLEVRARDAKAQSTTTTSTSTIPTTTIAKPAPTVLPEVAVAAAVAAANPNVTGGGPGAVSGSGSVADAPDLLPVATTTTLPPVKFEPTVEGHVDLPDDIRSPLVAGFQDVVGADGGTALSAFAGFPLSQYPIAGKTGTAQKSKEQDYAVFVGFGPVPAPKYVVSVVLEEGGYGRQAGAVVRRIFEGLAGFPINDVRIATGTSSER